MITIKKIHQNKYWISSVVALVFVFVIIPIIVSFYPSTFKMPLGVQVKNGDRIFYQFLDDVKKENGVIVMGTSETGNSLHGNNYWGLLDRDIDLNRHFYAFGGAGRCSYMYFPLILDNPEAFKDLEIIYYINPTYWRKGLNNFKEHYYERYMNESLALSVKNKAIEHGIFEKYMKPGIHVKSSIPFYFDRKLEGYKSVFYSDFMSIINPDDNIKAPSKIDVDRSKIQRVFQTIETETDLAFNACYQFMEQNTPFPEIDTESDFQSQMLIHFIQLINEYQINCTFYLGPYNEVYCQAMNPEFKQQHDEVVTEIKTILNDQQAKYIDGSYQSTVSGTFFDLQHISEYGAYLTAVDIKEYYESKKKNN